MHTRKSRASKIGATTYGESITQLHLSLFVFRQSCCSSRHHRCKNPTHTQQQGLFFWFYKILAGWTISLPPWFEQTRERGSDRLHLFPTWGPIHIWGRGPPCCSVNLVRPPVTFGGREWTNLNPTKHNRICPPWKMVSIGHYRMKRFTRNFFSSISNGPGNESG